MGHVHKVHFGRKALNVFGRPFEQKRIPHAHHQIVQLTPDVLVAPMHGQWIDAEPAAQAHRPK